MSIDIISEDTGKEIAAQLGRIKRAMDGTYFAYSLSEYVNGDNPDDILTLCRESITNIPDYACQSQYSLKNADFPAATEIGIFAFGSCTKLTNASFPAATGLGASAFKDCYKLESVDIPLITAIEESTFYDCRALKKVCFPNVTRIGKWAFYRCEGLTAADFSSLTWVVDQAFYSCTKLEALILRNTEAVCKLGGSNALPNKSKVLNIYVLAALVDEYKSAAYWSSYASKIKAIEDYPEIMGGLSG